MRYFPQTILPVLVRNHGTVLLVPSMVLTTLAVCALVTFVPQLVPLWSAMATGSRV